MSNSRARTFFWPGAALGLVAAALLAWVNLAVGIIDEPDAPANLMYFGVVAFGLLGAVLVRARPAGMARVMLAVAAAQLVVAVVTLAAGLGYPPTPPASLAVFNAILLAFWLGSAACFRKAAGRS
jgi:hypothetical protein